MTSDADFDAILFDAGGILVLPDPTVLGPLLAYYGGDPSIDAPSSARTTAAMAVKSAAGSGETFWDEYDHAYVECVGVPERRRRRRRDRARPHPQRVPVALADPRERRRRCARCTTRGVPIGVVSNASGQIEEVLAPQRRVPGRRRAPTCRCG